MANQGKNGSKNGKKGERKNKEEIRQEKIAAEERKAKLARIRNPRPDFTPRRKNTTIETPVLVEIEDVPTEKDASLAAKILWGNISRLGLVEIAGVTFRVEEKEWKGFLTISVAHAPLESGLLDAEFGKTYISIAQLRRSTFKTKLTAESSIAIQKAIYEFLRKEMQRHGLIKASEIAQAKIVADEYDPAKATPEVKQNKIQHDAETASEKMRNMILGTPGLFKSVDEEGRSAYFKSNGRVISFRGADNDHELGKLQLSGKLMWKDFVDLPDLKLERPNVVGFGPRLTGSMITIHAYLRKVGTKLGLGVKGSVSMERKIKMSETSATPIAVDNTPLISAPLIVAPTEVGVKKSEKPKGAKRISADKALEMLRSSGKFNCQTLH